MITFVGMASRTSGLIRGIQMSERLPGGQFVELGSNVPSKNKIVILLRNYAPHVVDFYKKQGCIVGYDIADMPVGDAVFRNKEVKDLRDYAHKECDFFVVNNSLVKADVAFMSDKPSFIVPHHSTNFDNVVSDFRDVPKLVGYVGLPEQLSGKPEIEKLCSAYGAQFISVHPNTREECDKIFRSIDVGIVFAESDSTMRPHVVELMKRFKPNTKLTNFQSYGIPTICTRYESYLEFGENACRFVDDMPRMLEHLTELLVIKEARQQEGQAAVAVGQKFHIDNIKKLYENIYKEFHR